MKTCDFETSEALHALGYDGECERDAVGSENGAAVPAPRLDDAACWLRTRHGYVIVVYPYHGSDDEDRPYMYDIKRFDRDNGFWEFVCRRRCNAAYEEALGRGLKEALRVLAEAEDGRTEDIVPT